MMSQEKGPQEKKPMLALIVNTNISSNSSSLSNGGSLCSGGSGSTRMAMMRRETVTAVPMTSGISKMPYVV